MVDVLQDRIRIIILHVAFTFESSSLGWELAWTKPSQKRRSTRYRTLPSTASVMQWRVHPIWQICELALKNHTRVNIGLLRPDCAGKRFRRGGDFTAIVTSTEGAMHRSCSTLRILPRMTLRPFHCHCIGCSSRRKPTHNRMHAEVGTLKCGPD